MKRLIDYTDTEHIAVMRELLLEIMPAYIAPNRELTYKQVWEQFNVSKPVLIDWEKKGLIHASRINGVRWSSHDVQRVIDMHRPKYKLKKAS